MTPHYQPDDLDLFLHAAIWRAIDHTVEVMDRKKGGNSLQTTVHRGTKSRTLSQVPDDQLGSQYASQEYRVGVFATSLRQHLFPLRDLLLEKKTNTSLGWGSTPASKLIQQLWDVRTWSDVAVPAKYSNLCIEVELDYLPGRPPSWQLTYSKLVDMCNNRPPNEAMKGYSAISNWTPRSTTPVSSPIEGINPTNSFLEPIEEERQQINLGIEGLGSTLEEMRQLVTATSAPQSRMVAIGTEVERRRQEIY